MVRFIKIFEGISPIKEGATSRLDLMRVVKYTKKIDKGCH